MEIALFIVAAAIIFIIKALKGCPSKTHGG